MTGHVNDGVPECFSYGVVRRTDEGPRERETLLYNETIAAVSGLYYSRHAGIAYIAQKLLGSTDPLLIGQLRSCIHRCNSREKAGKCSEV